MPVARRPKRPAPGRREWRRSQARRGIFIVLAIFATRVFPAALRAARPALEFAAVPERSQRVAAHSAVGG
jgi:hypothetical protein